MTTRDDAIGAVVRDARRGYTRLLKLGILEDRAIIKQQHMRTEAGRAQVAATLAAIAEAKVETDAQLDRLERRLAVLEEGAP